MLLQEGGIAQSPKPYSFLHSLYGIPIEPCFGWFHDSFSAIARYFVSLYDNVGKPDNACKS